MTRVGIVLAGGASVRMGNRDKSELAFEGKTLLANAIDRLADQCDKVLVSSSRTDLALSSEIPVVADSEHGQGPLGGILAGLRWIAANCPTASVLYSVAVDAPLFPIDLVDQLDNAAKQATSSPVNVVVAESGGDTHYVFGRWLLKSADELENWLKTSETLAVRAWCARQNMTRCQFDSNSDQAVSPFFNVNSPSDLTHLDAMTQQAVRLESKH